MEIVGNIAGGYILGYANYYNMADHLNQNQKLDFDKVLFLLTYALIIYANYTLINNALRLITGLIILTLIFKLIFEQTLYKASIIAIISYTLTIISELIYMLIILILLQIKPDIYIEFLTGNLFSNLTISIIIVILYHFTKSKLELIANWCDIAKDKIIIIISATYILFIGYFLFNAYKLNLKYDASFLISMIAIALFCYLILNILKDKAHSTQNLFEYNNLLEYSKTTEELLNEYRKSHHEYLNHLAIIKNMDSQKVSTYINKIIKEDKSNSYKYFNNLESVPNGGLRGLLHYKLDVMRSNGIEVAVDIKDNLAIITKQANTYYDFCRIMGIYLDNAIEATATISDKKITIEIYKIKTKIYATVSNTFEGNIELHKIDHEGYSTKGRNRGAGLGIANDIIKRNKNFRKKTKIFSNYFVQELIIE